MDPASALTCTRCIPAAQGPARRVIDPLTLHTPQTRRHQRTGVAQTHRTHGALPNHRCADYAGTRTQRCARQWRGCAADTRYYDHVCRRGRWGGDEARATVSRRWRWVRCRRRRESVIFARAVAVDVDVALKTELVISKAPRTMTMNRRSWACSLEL